MLSHIIKLATGLALLGIIRGQTHHHIGCFMDKAEDRDLNGRAIPYSDLQLNSCANECWRNGFPYFGLQNGIMCYCGKNFGKHSVYPPYKCNYTCSGKSCGGVLANDVYYALNTDLASLAERKRTIYSNLETFNDARQTCVKKDGDLAIVANTTQLDETLSLISSEGVSNDRIWFGLRRPLEGAPYEWTDATATEYHRDDYADWWKTNESWQNYCVVLIVAEKKWESTSCYAKYPFVCTHKPVTATETPPPIIDPNDDGDSSFDKKKLSLYIVLPLMMFCYGGSCIAYCSAKLWRNCRKQQRKKMLLENEETEYEPHNKPPPHRPLSARRVAPMPIHAVPYPVPTNEPPPRPIRTPVQEIGPSTSRRDSQPQTSRPTTSGAIALDLNQTSPPPPYYESKGKNKEKATKVREEQRRKLLLENALKEARGRREKERTLLDDEMETSLDSKTPKRPRSQRKKQYEVSDSSGTSPEPTDSMEMADRPRRKRRAKKQRPDEPDSGDSTTDLLAESRDPPKEPTMMSIAEIMKTKLMMNQGKKRPNKRIIQAA